MWSKVLPARQRTYRSPLLLHSNLDLYYLVHHAWWIQTCQRCVFHNLDLHVFLQFFPPIPPTFVNSFSILLHPHPRLVRFLLNQMQHHLYHFLCYRNLIPSRGKNRCKFCELKPHLHIILIRIHWLNCLCSIFWSLPFHTSFMTYWEHN